MCPHTCYLFARCLYGDCVHYGSNPDGLDIDKLANTERGKLSPVATALDAAEGQSWIGSGHTIDEDSAGFYAPGKSASTFNIACPQVAAQAKIGVVRQFYGMVGVTGANDSSDRPERFFVED